MRRRLMRNLALAFCLSMMPLGLFAQTTAIRAGRLIDPDRGTVETNQVILVEGEKIHAVGGNLSIPAGAEVIDLSRLSVLPGLVDAHNHLAITYKKDPESDVYYFTYVMD